MKEESQVALGFIIGSIAAIVYNKFIYREGLIVKLNGERLHHGELGREMIKSNDPKERGIGLALMLDDIKDIKLWRKRDHK